MAENLPEDCTCVGYEVLTCKRLCVNAPEYPAVAGEAEYQSWLRISAGAADSHAAALDEALCLDDGGFHEGFYDAETRAVAAWNRRAPPSSSVLERARDALKGCVDSLAFLRENGVYVWPNHPANPEQIARSALAEIDRALGGGKEGGPQK